MTIHLPFTNFFCFFFNDTPTTEIYTLSLHDALPILKSRLFRLLIVVTSLAAMAVALGAGQRWARSEEHTSELQSLRHLVCRLLLEKKKRMWVSTSMLRADWLTEA